MPGGHETHRFDRPSRHGTRQQLRVRPRPSDSPEEFFGGTIYQTPQGTLFGLRPVGSQGFDSEHTGLDHVSFAVDSRDELVRAAEAMDGAGIAHGDIIDLTDAGQAILSFQDPDDINMKLTAPLA